MGGNALKNCVTRRYKADEYYSLEKEVVSKFMSNLPLNFIVPIKSYEDKESFGDMDLLINSERSARAFVPLIENLFQPKEIVVNSHVISFEYKELQIDLIITKPEEFRSSIFYFAYNDLGNLMGRIAHKIGLKLGHDGLSYNWRVDTYQFKNIILSIDWKYILPVLGYSWERYTEGFDSLEDIFKYVVSSPHFNKDIFYLHNRNHTSRVRDAKRVTYTKFLKWLESYEETEEQKVNALLDKDHYLKNYLFKVIPEFEILYNSVQAEWQDAINAKEKFNGSLVSEWTGLTGKELGNFMQHLKSIETFSSVKSVEEIKDRVIRFYNKITE